MRKGRGVDNGREDNRYSGKPKADMYDEGENVITYVHTVPKLARWTTWDVTQATKQDLPTAKGTQASSLRSPAVGSETLVERDGVTAGVLPVRNARGDLPRLLVLHRHLRNKMAFSRTDFGRAG